ncbi:trypsin-3-like [Leptidea sinapis]|uniref:trypsin-3-like n=1 Tax=Leptidea sinapis TaxID=189913 RepID=UPI0021C3F1C7|nr:trypsin-3-like [Leptidea sinapis]
MKLLFVIIAHITFFTVSADNAKKSKVNEHSSISDNELFPYMAAILKKSSYISAGALIDDSWILTGADALYTLRDIPRLLRIRLGSSNYKKGGVLSPVKMIHIHPHFDDSKPEFDLALVRLSTAVTFSINLNPIRLLKKRRNLLMTHFIVTSWSIVSQEDPKTNSQGHESMEVVKRRRLLTKSHLHPTDAEECGEQLQEQGVNVIESMLCLDTSVGMDPCERETGAPAVLNGVLWGIISSWKSEDCDTVTEPTFVTLVSHINVSSWIHATIHGHRWTRKHVVDYRDNFI